MTSELVHAVGRLRDAAARFATGKLSSVAYSNERETCLADALRAMAAEHRIRLREPLQVDSRGEFTIVARAVDETPPSQGAGRFGDAFALALTRHCARTGTAGPTHIIGENGWCLLNHFDAERMVSEYHDQCVALQAAAPPTNLR
jgi:hypothetical protein